MLDDIEHTQTIWFSAIYKTNLFATDSDYIVWRMCVVKFDYTEFTDENVYYEKRNLLNSHNQNTDIRLAELVNESASTWKLIHTIPFDQLNFKFFENFLVACVQKFKKKKHSKIQKSRKTKLVTTATNPTVHNSYTKKFFVWNLKLLGGQRYQLHHDETTNDNW